jgi:hypothetical protein
MALFGTKHNIFFGPVFPGIVGEPLAADFTLDHAGIFAVRATAGLFAEVIAVDILPAALALHHFLQVGIAGTAIVASASTHQNTSGKERSAIQPNRTTHNASVNVSAANVEFFLFFAGFSK